jgi:PAS domain S-box-containing protein
MTLRHSGKTPNDNAEPSAWPESEERYRSFLRNFQGIAFRGDLSFTPIFFEGAVERITGYTSEDFVNGGLHWDTVVHDEDKERFLKESQRLFEVPDTELSREYRIVRRNGEVRWVQELVRNVCDSPGKPTHVEGSIYDITERKLTEQTLRREQDFSEALLETSGMLVVVFDSEGRVIRMNHTCEIITGRDRHGLLGRIIWDLVVAPEDRDLARRQFDTLRSGTCPENVEYHWIGANGDLRLIAWSMTCLREDRDVKYVVATGVDITERKQMERRLIESNQALQTLIEAAPMAILTFNADGRVTMWNLAAEKVFGWKAEEVVGRHVPYVPDEEREQFESIVARGFKGETVSGLDVQRKKKDGTPVYVRLFTAPIRDENGGITGIINVLTDETQNRQLQTQLIQSQRLESVGRLAGGVAHDFNNLLTIINGYSELVMSQLDEFDPLHRSVTEIRKAGERAAALTRQLLAFSRRQVMRVSIVDINTVVADMDKMLRRLIGEDIQLMTCLEASLRRVKTDGSQIEQVIMNLAVNARDAMPQGGKLTIETANVDLDANYAAKHQDIAPGPYVMLAVSDTGSGMDRETQLHIFEPFFSTKEDSKGTGLGRSIVYGIVKQSGGCIWVYSEPGYGTTFKVYLPAVEDEAAAIKSARILPGSGRGSELILLVEDEDSVRRLITGILKSGGYTVLEAMNAGDALVICEKHKEAIDLMITDVIMPNMSGAELAARLADTRPDMKVLFMSGYPDEAVVNHGIIDHVNAFIQKPFTPEVFLQKVRTILDAPRTPVVLPD